MGRAIEKIGQLSEMKRTLTSGVIEELKGNKGNYLDRLSTVAKSCEKNFMSGDLISGTTISRFSILTHSKRGRLITEVMPPGHAMFVCEMPTEHGYLVIFPMRTVGLSESKIPIIEKTSDEKFYTVAHLPKNPSGHTETFNPAKMIADFTFTVGSDSYVTVNGLNTVTAEEFTLFDEIVCELESRLITEQ